MGPYEVAKEYGEEVAGNYVIILVPLYEPQIGHA
jgi:hypothetical protein